MSGSMKLSEQEKQEMVLDAKNGNRAKAFHSARMLSQKGSLDDYIDFLSENMGTIPLVPTKRKTKYFYPSFRSAYYRHDALRQKRHRYHQKHRTYKKDLLSIICGP